MKDLVIKAVSDFQKLYDNRVKITGLSTGFKMLDRMTDGLHGGDLFVIAARSYMGKTSLAMNMAEHIALEQGKPVAVFSLDLSSQQFVERLLCSVARVNLANIRNGLLRVRDFPPLTAGSSKLAAAKIFIDDTSGLSIAKLRAKAGRMKREHDIRAIFIDYLQLIWSTSRSAEEDREVELAEISASLKALAKKLNVPIVVLAHLYRRPGFCTTNPEGRPRLSDLREAGSIAQDGDIVTLLAPELYFREKDEGKEEVGGKATLIIAKQRNGPIGAVPLTFLKEFTRFEDRREKGVDANGSE